MGEMLQMQSKIVPLYFFARHCFAQDYTALNSPAHQYIGLLWITHWIAGGLSIYIMLEKPQASAVTVCAVSEPHLSCLGKSQKGEDSFANSHPEFKAGDWSVCSSTPVLKMLKHCTKYDC